MICRMDDLQRKDVIHVRDGSRLGTVGDAEIDTDSARLTAIIIYGKPRLFGLMGHEDDLVIRWCDIEVIGADTILVNGPLPSSTSRRKFTWLKRMWGG